MTTTTTLLALILGAGVAWLVLRLLGGALALLLRLLLLVLLAVALAAAVGQRGGGLPVLRGFPPAPPARPSPDAASPQSGYPGPDALRPER